MAWTLRVRAGDALASVSLEGGAETLADDAVALAAAAAGVCAASCVVRFGFPRRELRVGSAGENATVAAAGLHDRDLLVVDGVASEEQAAASGAAAAAETPPPSKKQKRGGGAFAGAGQGRRLGGGDAALGQLEASPQALLASPDGEVGGAAQAAIQQDLVRAVAGGAGGNTKQMKLLYQTFRNALQERSREAEGNARVAAALAGKVEFRPLGDGRLVAKFALGRRNKFDEDIVQDVDPVLLGLVLKALATDPDEETRAYLTNPAAMAVASPRIFWALVRHGNLGPYRGFREALEAVIPEGTWEEVGRRERKKPERYANYDTSGA